MNHKMTSILSILVLRLLILKYQLNCKSVYIMELLQGGE